MSVIMYLSKPIYDVDYLGSKYDFATKEYRDKVDNFMNKNLEMTEEDDKEWEEMFATRYSDGEVYTSNSLVEEKNRHSIIDISWYYWVASTSKSCKASKRYAKKLEKLGYKVFKPKYGDAMKYITVNEIVYRQGWFFKKNFFNKGTTTYVATTKKEMIWFFKKYVDFNNKKDNRATEAYNTFLNAWEDGMIFICTF